MRDENAEMTGLRETRHITQRAPEELYDLKEDPQETTNLINDPALKDTAEQMRTTLLNFRRQTEDPWLEVDYQQGRIKDNQIK